MAEITAIITHPGGAHADEFLACSVLLARHAVAVERREPADADLLNPAVCVVDVGLQHDPSRHNFDHHQLPKDHPPTCALSLVLQHLGVYDDARLFCDWLEATEWFDTRGPIETAGWLGTTPDTLARLTSPVATTLLRRFAQLTRLQPGDPIWELMRMIGTDLLAYIRTLRDRLNYLEQHAEWWTLDLAGKPAQVLFVPRAEPPLEDPSLGVDRFIRAGARDGVVVATVSPDRRGSGYGLERYRDNPRVDFTRIASRPGVHFVHARGFVAKTTITDVAELQALLQLAAVPQTGA